MDNAGFDLKAPATLPDERWGTEQEQAELRAAHRAEHQRIYGVPSRP